MGPGRYRTRGARLLHDLHHGPNVTPMVDVVMVILIFFMASTVLLGPELLLRASVEREPEPAEAAQEEASFRIEAPRFEVRLSAERGRVVAAGLGLEGGDIGGIETAAALLAERLGRRALGETMIVIDAGDDVPYEAVVRANELIRAAGFERVGVR